MKNDKETGTMKRLGKIFSIITYSLLIIGFAGCASNKVEDSYYQANAGDFSTLTLDNGIPVVMKNTGRGQITVLRMVIEGGTPLITADKSGIEDITLDLIFHGSEKYSYAQIQQHEYESSFSISTTCGKDYSIAGIKCINRDFDTALDVFADSYLNPLLKQEDFNQLLQGNAISIQRSLNDPSGLLGIELQKLVYEGHEYAADSKITADSYDNISFDDVKAHYQTMLDSKRLRFVVVGNLSEGRGEEIRNKLNGYFGTLASKDYKKPVISKVKLNKKTVYAANQQAGNVGYAVGYFDAPERYDEDYVPFAMSLMILDNVLYDHVREQNSAVYSIGTGILGGKDIIGVLSIFKSTKNKEVKKLVAEAIEKFPTEKEIEAKLENYKAKYITSLFSSSQNVSGVATNIIVSMEYSGDPSKYLTRSAEVQKVTPKQIRAAYKKYIEPQKFTWVVVSGEEALKEFEF